ncbi:MULTISPECIES: antitoxin Xre/MbcA/ParS toxin-binding domain-containing protein [Bosea]|uniref:DUF2384 domain-containing protein n=3 Tax=Bosea TaxID=85413 RepID=A0A927EC73_9HYPH|nr:MULTISPECIES: antitoxin Xre/MbcA/ParS toxin-binding domain-containing protein [Bosea]MCP4559300.1 DUF2384 domain-containing protein [Bosea sp. (in: a-proteobacteria)]PZR80860.1 MAG: DUF2384 domain-containing protein [Stutzerimonas stutzeri]MBD3847310.1 DUF2384 domain-containing protein [Bosea spartocytisi]MCP4733901.1 DUF2384 domain-containing protein [Bosea sp. (in: a-proteobacteria)]MCT4475380.1 DUF2384 domain-containing protein [Bosea spartocytisi]
MAHAERLGPAIVSGFMQKLQEPKTPYISPGRFSKVLGIQVSSLAKMTGVHRNTLRKPSSERLQGRFREMAKVITAAAELAGDLDKAIYWFMNEPISDYDHKTAAELVAEGHSEAVLRYLQALEIGASG